MTTLVELKPCPNPWCISTGMPLPTRFVGGFWRATCVCGVATHRHDTEAEAITAWNTRAADTIIERQAKAIDEAREALACIEAEVFPNPISAHVYIDKIRRVARQALTTLINGGEDGSR